jgi:hypothetical protein
MAKGSLIGVVNRAAHCVEACYTDDQILQCIRVQEFQVMCSNT